MMATLSEFDPDFASPADWAIMYRTAGLQCVPAPYPMRKRDDKRPSIGWKQYQDDLAEDEAFDRWFPSNCSPNMGVIAGRASSNLLVIDLDDYKPGTSAGEWWTSVTSGVDRETWTQTTGGGGRQVFFRLPAGVTISSHRTAMGVDIRSQGGFAMLPPSMHMSGKEYAWMRGLGPWECDIEEAPQFLIDAVLELIEDHGGVVNTGPVERTQATSDFSAFGSMTDGREDYMTRLVWGAVVDWHRECPIHPGEGESVERMREAYGAYERNVASRINEPTASKSALLEREGRGASLFAEKWRNAMRQWDGKVSEHAREARLSPSPLEQARSAAPPAHDIPDGDLILSPKQFVDGFTPPEYLIDGMIQQGYLYSLTARTGHGKTAVGMYLGQAVARGVQIKDRFVKQGSVLFLAGENPDDIRARYLVLAEAEGFDPETTPIHFIAGVIDIAACLSRIHEEAAKIPDLALVIVDTAAAYFKGDDGNSNAQMGEYARLLRQFSFLPGKPAVVVPSHPIKNASKDNLLPVGGGAFLNEVDGNLTLWSNAEKQTTLHWQGKFRGPEFEPLAFRLETRDSARVVNAAGELMPSVVAVPIGDFELEAGEAQQESEENILLGVIGMNPKASVAVLAHKARFMGEAGQPQKSKVFRICARLVEDKLIERHRGGKYKLTAKGRREIGLDDED